MLEHRWNRHRVVRPLARARTALKGAEVEAALTKTAQTAQHAEHALADAAKAERAAGEKDIVRHDGFRKNYAGHPKAELQKGITSIEKQIAEHQDKIVNPEKHIPNWRNLDPRQRQALVTKKWPSDIQRQKEQLAILKSLLENGK